MSTVMAAYDHLIECFVAWAEAQPDIRAALILGSRTRVDHPADEWSDLDLLFFTTDPRRYVANTDWLRNLGPYWLIFFEPEVSGDTMECSVLFDGALDVDFVLIPVEALRNLLRDGLTPDVMAAISRGFRIIVDKDGFSDAFKSLSLPPITHELPSEGAFLNVVNDFWYRCVWTAKKLRRGETWTARGGLDRYMAWHCLLPMIEWHARATKGRECDTWHGGRFLEQWADARALEGLRTACSHYDGADIRRGMVATMELFRWLAKETAERLGYPYPVSGDEHVTEWVRTCLSEIGTT